MKRTLVAITLIIVLTASFAAIVQAQDEAPALAAPVLTATPNSTGITLEWNAVPGAVHYQLWFWTKEDGWNVIENSLTRTIYNHEYLASSNLTPLTEGRTYYYIVKVYDDDSFSWSNYANAVAPKVALAVTAACSLRIGPIEAEELRPGVRERYKKQFDEDPGRSSVFAVDFLHNDGATGITILDLNKGRFAVEYYRGCNYIMTLGWIELDLHASSEQDIQASVQRLHNRFSSK